MEKKRTYFCIDMKCFYASVECAERGLNPFETPLVVADKDRGKNALCLAISPKMKSLGIRLTENGAMYPQASVSGLYLGDPNAEYFSM